MRAIEFLQKISITFSSNLLLEFVECGIFSSLMQLLEEFPFNNLLQLRVDQLMSKAMEKLDSGIVLEHIVENSGLLNLILKVGNEESKLTFENTKMKINLGYTVFVRKWASRLQELIDQGSQTVKLAVESIPELEKYFNGELKRIQDFEKGHLLENPRKAKEEKADFIDDNDFDFFSKISKLRRDEIKAAADSEGSGKTQDLGIELDFTEEQDGEQGLSQALILNDLVSSQPDQF